MTEMPNQTSRRAAIGFSMLSVVSMIIALAADIPVLALAAFVWLVAGVLTAAEI